MREDITEKRDLWGVPHEEVLERLEELKRPTLRLDRLQSLERLLHHTTNTAQGEPTLAQPHPRAGQLWLVGEGNDTWWALIMSGSPNERSANEPSEAALMSCCVVWPDELPALTERDVVLERDALTWLTPERAQGERAGEWLELCEQLCVFPTWRRDLTLAELKRGRALATLTPAQQRALSLVCVSRPRYEGPGRWGLARWRYQDPQDPTRCVVWEGGHLTPPQDSRHLLREQLARAGHLSLSAQLARLALRLQEGAQALLQGSAYEADLEALSFVRGGFVGSLTSPTVGGILGGAVSAFTALSKEMSAQGEGGSAEQPELLGEFELLEGERVISWELSSGPAGLSLTLQDLTALEREELIEAQESTQDPSQGGSRRAPTLERLPPLVVSFKDSDLRGKTHRLGASAKTLPLEPMERPLSLMIETLEGELLLSCALSL
jgi:hypothetical protein